MNLQTFHATFVTEERVALSEPASGVNVADIETTVERRRHSVIVVASNLAEVVRFVESEHVGEVRWLGIAASDEAFETLYTDEALLQARNEYIARKLNQ